MWTEIIRYHQDYTMGLRGTSSSSLAVCFLNMTGEINLQTAKVGANLVITLVFFSLETIRIQASIIVQTVSFPTIYRINK